jgi:hypothetical protein
MGYRVSDGKGLAFTFPSGQVINDGDLYRINQWNFAVVGSMDASQLDRTRTGEVDPAAIWNVKVPAAVNPAVGDCLSWTTGAGFKRGDTDLQAAALGSPVIKVWATKNAAGYIQGRILNVGP